MSESTEWSRSWTASSDPSKQRKYRQNAPHHQRGQFLSAHLAESVQDRIGTRSVPVRTGDKVEVMRGDHAGETGRVDDIDTDKAKIYVEGVEREAVDGSDVTVAIDPSNLKITRLDLDDPERLAEHDVSEEDRDEIGVEPETDDEDTDAGDDTAGDTGDEDDADAEPAGEETPGDVVEGTVDDVKDAVREGAADPAAVLDAERQGKDRVTLVEWLENRVEADGEVDE